MRGRVQGAVLEVDSGEHVFMMDMLAEGRLAFRRGRTVITNLQ